MPVERNGDYERGYDAGFREYKMAMLGDIRRALNAIEALNNKFDSFKDTFKEEIAARLAKQDTDIALLKFQAAMWGAVAGALLSVIATVIARMVLH